ncbi:MAG: hypothetical protein KAT15_02990 [Bacteroidales bacterium]|nr:hypothetical protein [Bacteroidales bacterium]
MVKFASSYKNVIGGVAASAVESISRNMGADPFAPSGIYNIVGSSDHGVRLLESNPELITEAIEWVRDL